MTEKELNLMCCLKVMMQHLKKENSYLRVELGKAEAEIMYLTEEVNQLMINPQTLKRKTLLHFKKEIRKLTFRLRIANSEYANMKCRIPFYKNKGLVKNKALEITNLNS